VLFLEQRQLGGEGGPSWQQLMVPPLCLLLLLLLLLVVVVVVGVWEGLQMRDVWGGGSSSTPVLGWMTDACHYGWK
jgi:hypothetical protein